MKFKVFKVLDRENFHSINIDDDVDLPTSDNISQINFSNYNTFDQDQDQDQENGSLLILKQTLIKSLISSKSKDNQVSQRADVTIKKILRACKKYYENRIE
jgi:hypothetical protein